MNILKKAKLRMQRNISMRVLVPALVQLYAVNPPAALLLVDTIWETGSGRAAGKVLEYLAEKWMTTVVAEEEEESPPVRGLGW